MSQDLSQVMATLDTAGITPEDRQTTSLGLNPLYAQDPTGGQDQPNVVGYRAQSLLLIRVPRIAALGGLIDALASAGVNRIDAISFDVADPAAAAASAREQAVRDARTKAGQYADAAGVALGEVVAISDFGGGGPRPMAAARMADSSAAVPIAEGSIIVSADVQVTYRLADTP